jgi:hypothetical protein
MWRFIILLCAILSVAVFSLWAVPAQVPQPVWNVQTDVIGWSAVSGADDYAVQLYKNGSAFGSEISGVTATSYDFHTTLLGDGTPSANNNKYSVKVRARDGGGFGAYSISSLNNTKGLSGLTILGCVDNLDNVTDIVWSSGANSPFVYSAATQSYAKKIRHEVRGIHIYLPNYAQDDTNNPVTISGTYYGYLGANITLITPTSIVDSVYLDLEMARRSDGLSQAANDQNNIITIVVNPGNTGFEKTYTLNFRRRMGCTAASISQLSPVSPASITGDRQFSATIAGSNTVFGDIQSPLLVNGDQTPTYTTLKWQVIPGTGTAYIDDAAILHPLSNGTIKVRANTYDGTNLSRTSLNNYTISGMSDWAPHIGKLILRNANTLTDTIRFSPAFRADQVSGTTYTAGVANGITALQISTMAPADCQLYVNNSRIENNAEVVIKLRKGLNTIPIRVVKGAASKTYNLNITRENEVRLQFGDANANLAPYISAPNGTQFGLNTAADKTRMTIEAWIKWTSTPSGVSPYQWANIATMDRQGSSDVGQFWLQHDVTNQRFEFAVRTTGGRNYVQSRTTPLKDVWYHVAGVLSGGKIRIFVNGIEEANTNRTGEINPIQANDRLYIGKSPSTGLRVFNGNIRQVRLWIGTSRGPGQILSDYQGIDPVNPAPSFAWNLDETAPGAVQTSLGNVTLSQNSVTAEDFTAGSTVNESAGQTFVFRPTRMDLSSATSESVVLVSARDYNESGRLRFDSTSQFNVWNPATSTWVTPSSNSQGIDFINPPTSSTMTRFWVPIQRGANTTGNANYVDALSSNYASNNVVMPLGAITPMASPFSITGNFIGTVQYPSTAKYVVLGFDQEQYGTLICAASTVPAARKDGKGTSAFTLVSDVAIKRIEVRTLDDDLILSRSTETPWNGNTDLGDQTLPVELSSFTAVVVGTNSIRLDWTAQSETNLCGYYVYRNIADDMNSAIRIQALIPAENSSTQTSYSFTDGEAETGKTWYYWLQSVDMSGESEFHGPVSIYLDEDNGTGTPYIPIITSLQKVYPNPFNPNTTIVFGMAAAGHVKLDIYNLKGEKVKSLKNEAVSAGTYRILWDGRADNGSACSTGVYYLKMSSGTYSKTHKLILMK